MAKADPDAIWKPGYTGEVVLRPPEARAGRASGRRRFAIVGIVGITVAVVAGGLAVSEIVRDGATAESSERDHIPTNARSRWTVTLDALEVIAVTGSTDTIVAATGPEPMLVALAAGSGGERWRARRPRSDIVALELVEGVVVSVYLDDDGEQSMVTFDVRDGHRLWAETLAVGGQALIEERQIVVMRFGPSGRLVGVELVDPATGVRVGAVEGDEIALSRTSIQRRVGNVIEWFERASFEPRGRLRLAATGLTGVSVAGVAPTAAGLVVAASGAVSLLDVRGTVVSAVELSTEPDHLEVLEVDELDGSGRFVILQGRGRLTMFSIDGGTLTELWERRAWVVDWLIDDTRQLVALVPQRDEVGGDDAAGGSSLVIVEATTGRPIWTGRLARALVPFRGILARNGFIAAAELRKDDTSAITGYAFDGTSRWRHLLADDVRTSFVPGALVTVGADDVTGDATLTLFS